MTVFRGGINRFLGRGAFAPTHRLLATLLLCFASMYSHFCWQNLPGTRALHAFLHAFCAPCPISPLDGTLFPHQSPHASFIFWSILTSYERRIHTLRQWLTSIEAKKPFLPLPQPKQKEARCFPPTQAKVGSYTYVWYVQITVNTEFTFQIFYVGCESQLLGILNIIRIRQIRVNNRKYYSGTESVRIAGGCWPKSIRFRPMAANIWWRMTMVDS